MTPKEKARQLIEKYNHIDEYYYDESFKDTDLGKQCALIAVDEIINLLGVSSFLSPELTLGYWLKVKKEIESL